MQNETSSVNPDRETRQPSEERSSALLWTGKTGPFEPEMILIPAGPFLIGSNPEAVPAFEEVPVRNAYIGGWTGPRHRLDLPDFYIAKTPITNGQYAAFLQETGHRRPKRWRSDKSPRGKEDFPVVYVSWHDAVAYCRWLASAVRKPYRLPSEAEWEKAASWEDPHAASRQPTRPQAAEDAGHGNDAGLKGRQRRYPWGDEWQADSCNTVESEPSSVTPVDAYPRGASPYGLLDMAGNVWEWTRSLWGGDWYTPAFDYPYDSTDGREDLEADDILCRVLRGGSYAYSRDFARCAFRYKNFPENSSDGTGFRVVLTAD
jgi:formylglycine-generating enzyme required for sulfatase activity